MANIKRRAVFLDRDGTLNVDPGYLHSPEQVQLLPNVGEGLALLKKLGFLLIVVSNQSGIGRGLIDARILPKIHDRMDEILRPWGVKIDDYQFCPHHPDELCECRKPKPKLVLDAAIRFEIDLSKSYFIGDKESDLAAGVAAGCRASILVRTGSGRETERQAPQVSFVGDSLLDAAHWIQSQENEDS